MALLDFILRAKRTGYAGGDSREIRFDDGSVGYEQQSGDFIYLDRYTGTNPFVGVEKIFSPGRTLLWAMNYYGRVLTDSTGPQDIYAFLREALLELTPEYPFRGPAVNEKNGFRYANNQQGDLDRFHGIEQIYMNEKKIYELYYHGGQMETGNFIDNSV